MLGDISVPHFASPVTQPSPGTYYRTLRTLRWPQFAHLARRRFLPAQKVSRWPLVAVKFREPPCGVEFPEWKPSLARQILSGKQLDFVDEDARTSRGMPWAKRFQIYQTNYCDFLNVCLTKTGDEALLRAALELTVRWVLQNRNGDEVGWEPFPLSLRIVNWLKFLIRNAQRAREIGADGLLAGMLAHLRIQVLVLENRLEEDLLANHLLKNVVALLFAGALLEVDESRRWWERGEALLRRELTEQILADGGHIERSPMYHAWLLADLIDVHALIAGSGRSCAAAEQLTACISRMADFFAHTLHPDGDIPLFNDGVLGVISVPELLTRASRLSGSNLEQVSGVRIFADTGYAVMRNGSSKSALIFDCGPLGPDYQPGHSHCDVLSYELSLDGQRVVVDTGTSTYGQGEVRHYERSTAAHNTVRIDGLDQAEIWGEFRVGRRPRIGHLRATEIGGFQVVYGEHYGFRGRGLTHSRAVIHGPNKTWLIVDLLRGSGVHLLESFIHLHPSVGVVQDECGAFAGSLRLQFGGRTYSLAALDVDKCAIEDAWYAPEFGQRLAQKVVRLSFQGHLPAMMIVGFWPFGEDPVVVRSLPQQAAIELNGMLIPISA